MTNTFLFRDPGKNKQVIPGAVMGMAGLEQAECLRIHAEGGHILISDSDLTPREKVNLITQLYNFRCLTQRRRKMWHKASQEP